MARMGKLLIPLLCAMALALTGCAGAPSLDVAERPAEVNTVASADPATSEQYYDACAISTTGADRNGQPFPKEVVKVIKREIERRKVDCDAYLTPAIASGKSPAPHTGAEPSAPALSFQQ